MQVYPGPGAGRQWNTLYKFPWIKRPAIILIIADDQSVRRKLKRLFEIENLTVQTRGGLRAGLDSFSGNHPSAIVLDLQLSNLSKQHLCEELKAAAPLVPVIVLSASRSIHHKIALLDKGADDYVTKPFNSRELVARLRAALRRSQGQHQTNQITFGEIVVDLEKVKITRKGRSLDLTGHEFKTLRFLLQNADRVIERAELLKEACGYKRGFVATRCVDNHILKIRQKLESDPHHPTHFKTVRLVGYKFIP
jgi:DNA-binding response OmpR family regulator